MLDTVRVAAVAVDCQPGEVKQNLEKIEHWTAHAAAAGAQLVLFPELSLSGFVPNHPVGDHNRWLREALALCGQMAEPLEGPSVERLTAVAQRHGCLVSAGMLENAGKLLHNTQVLVGPQGLLGVWRKMHIPMFEMPFYNGGPAVRAFDTPLGRVGVNICFDTLLPESTRLLAVDGAEIVLFPFAADPPPATPAGWAAWAGPALQARCVENGVFGLAVDYVGHVTCAGATQDFPGGGLAVGPRGEVLAQWSGPAGEPGLMLAEFSRATLLAAQAEPEYLFRFRRPELYRRLAE